MLKKWLNKPLKYVELCKIIKEPAKKGKSKQLHIKRIEKYTDIEKTGSKYIIHKVYENDDEMQIIESQGRFTTYLRRFMINMFCELKREYPDKHTIVLTNRDILEQACMVNQNYFVGKNSPYKFLDFLRWQSTKVIYQTKNICLTKYILKVKYSFRARTDC